MVEGHENGTFTHLVEFNPLFVPPGTRVGNPQGSKLGPEEIGGVPFHGGDVEAEHLGSDAFGAGRQVVCNKDDDATQT